MAECHDSIKTVVPDESNDEMSPHQTVSQVMRSPFSRAVCVPAVAHCALEAERMAVATASFDPSDWADMTPLSLEEGPDAVIKIAYPTQCEFASSSYLTWFGITCSHTES